MLRTTNRVQELPKDNNCTKYKLLRKRKLSTDYCTMTIFHYLCTSSIRPIKVKEILKSLMCDSNEETWHAYRISVRKPMPKRPLMGRGGFAARQVPLWGRSCNDTTYYIVQSPSWEANRFAASQEIPRISRNPKVHYRTHKRPPPFSILGQPNPVHIPTSHLLEIRPNIIHPSTPRFPQWSPSLRFPHPDPIHPSLLTHTRHMPRIVLHNWWNLLTKKSTITSYILKNSSHNFYILRA